MRSDTMNLRAFADDDDAVSPVIGVILMVAITVILAAVIGTFVLGLGDQVQTTAPSASFTFDYDADSSVLGADSDLFQTADDSTSGDLTITHDGGAQIEAARLAAKDDDGGSVSPWSGDVNAGTSVTIDVGGNDTVRVVWTSEGGDQSATLGKFSGPDA